MKFLSIFLASLCLFAACTSFAARVQIRVSDPKDNLAALEFLVNSHYKIQIHVQKTQTDIFENSQEPDVFSNMEDPTLPNLIQKSWKQYSEGDYKIFEFDLVGERAYRLRFLGQTPKTRVLKRTGELFGVTIDTDNHIAVRENSNNLAAIPGSSLTNKREVIFRKIGYCKSVIDATLNQK